MRTPITSLIQGSFRLIGLDVQRNSQLWEAESEFSRLMQDIRPHTLVSDDRCFMLYQYVKFALHTPGAMAEVGVYQGGTAKLIAQAAPEKTLHLFDTFDGLPSPSPEYDQLPEGDFADTSLAQVEAFMSDCRNAVFHQGFFPQTGKNVEDETFSFVYLDADLYRSIKDSLEFFYPRLNTGGVIIVDDYGWKECPGVKKAVGEFLADKVEVPIVARRYQCIIVKTTSCVQDLDSRSGPEAYVTNPSIDTPDAETTRDERESLAPSIP